MVPDSTSSLSGGRARSGDAQLALDSDRFRFIASLGAGAMGSVSLAEDTKLHRHVAIKSVKHELSRDPEFRKRLERECLLHAKVGPHPHIVTLFDRIESDGQIHLVMEYVEGESLQSMLERNAEESIVLPVAKSLQIGLQCLEALSRIHTLGIIHRDIKPSNIMITHSETGQVCAKLMDFGVARMADDDEQLSRLTTTDSGGPGTPLYMAPEQIDSRTFGEISAATDVYSMGILLFQMFSGAPPFRGTLTEVLNAHVNIPAPRLDSVAPGRIPAALADVLQQALAKRSKNRYATVKQFSVDLVQVQAQITHPGNLPPAEWAVSHAEDLGSTIRPMRIAEAETRLTGTSVVRLLVRRKRNIATLAIGLIGFLVLAFVASTLVLSMFRGNGRDTAETEQSGPIGTQVAPPTSPILARGANAGQPGTANSTANSDGSAGMTSLNLPRVIEPAPQWYIQLAQMNWSFDSETVVSVPGFVQDELLAANVSPASDVDGVVMNPGSETTENDSTGTLTPEDLAGREHVVQPGDSLSKIAGQYGINVGDLQWWNGIRNANTLSVGQSLKLHASSGLPPREQFFAEIAKAKASTKPVEEAPPPSTVDQPPLVADTAPSEPAVENDSGETNNPVKKLWRKIRGKS
jgi:serine/threonine-protein kinase